MTGSRLATDHPVSDAARIVTIPNLLSLLRILLIPVFALLLLDQGTESAGLAVLGLALSTDWLDGLVARRTGQVSRLGEGLDPLADRLTIIAALIVLGVTDVIPLWAALLVVVRETVVLAAVSYTLLVLKVQLKVHRIGKVATCALMVGIPALAWASFGLPLSEAARVLGWAAYAVGCVLCYVAAIAYGRDIAAVLRPAAREVASEQPLRRT